MDQLGGRGDVDQGVAVGVDRLPDELARKTEPEGEVAGLVGLETRRRVQQRTMETPTPKPLRSTLDREPPAGRLDSRAHRQPRAIVVTRTPVE